MTHLENQVVEEFQKELEELVRVLAHAYSSIYGHNFCFAYLVYFVSFFETWKIL
jgi:hypothetical protein